MKRIGLIVILALLLCGCGAEQTMETLAGWLQS
jgi:PBP1b-binding outer membrane lipoprotein LpoB